MAIESDGEGKGVLMAVHNINEHIAPALKGIKADVLTIDAQLCELDGTPNKSRLGANAVLAVSLAAARAIAYARNLPLYRFLAELAGNDQPIMPTPMVNIISGGLHAGGNLDMQDFLIIPCRRRFLSAGTGLGRQGLPHGQANADGAGLDNFGR
jgi:enolase